MLAFASKCREVKLRSVEQMEDQVLFRAERLSTKTTRAVPAAGMGSRGCDQDCQQPTSFTIAAQSKRNYVVDYLFQETKLR